MKHCPKCDSTFPDTDQFCERDGTTLVGNNPDTSRKAVIVVAVAVAAMALGILLFLAYQRLTNETVASSPSQSSSNQPATQLVVPPPPLFPSPSPSESPSPSPSPSVTPTPAVQTQPARVPLSTSPVSTSVDANKRGEVTIRLTDGTSIKADEAWETGEGIWYRRRGIVTLLKRDQVKGFEYPSPSPSPTPSPVASP